MARGITLKLTKGENILVKEAEKKHCFFVGKEGEATNAAFEHAYEISHEEWPKDVQASFEIGSRKFSGLSYARGKTLSKAKGTYNIKKHPDGTVYLCMDLDYPAYDSYDKMYASHFQRVIYRENGEVVVIQAKYGRVVPKINVYIGLEQSVPFLDRLLDVLEDSNAAQVSRLTMLTRCVAQKYWLSDEIAAAMENFVLYTCLGGAGFSASYSWLKSRGRMHSFDLLKSIADDICGTCLPEWYQTPVKRRYEVLSDVFYYIRKLKRDKYVEWSSEEKALCNQIRKLADASAFSELYAVTLVLLRFMAENDFKDVFSLKKAAMAPGIFSATLMADTVDGFSAKQLDGEAKKAFFSLVGQDAQKAKERIEKSLYHYHASSSLLFQNTRSLSLQSGGYSGEGDAKARESAVEKAVLSAGACMVVAYRQFLSGADKGQEQYEQRIVRALYQKIIGLYDAAPPGADDEEIICDKLMQIARFYLSEETKKMHRATPSTHTLMYEFVPEKNFVFVYLIGFVLIRFLQQAALQSGAYDVAALQYLYNKGQFVGTGEVGALILEAKCRYGMLSGSGVLEIIAQLDEDIN